jgi:NTP pyrophosphatase (non-canonical NTP hydrolase)
MNSIRELVKAKGHEDDCSDNAILKKGLFAIMETSEAMEIVKKKGIDNLTREELDKLSEELIDVIFYILDIYGILKRDKGIESPDKIFVDKLKKNFSREYYYGRPGGFK